MSGANSTPLGRMNPAIGCGKRGGSSLLNPSYMGGSSQPSTGTKAIQQSFISTSAICKSDYFDINSNGSTDSGTDRKKRRKSRWQGGEKEKTFIPGMPTILPSNMNKDQEEAYLMQLQIEELSRRLRSNDLGIPPNPEDRSPSPEPIYNNEGKRLNTREYRTRKKLEDDRHGIIMKMQNLNPEYKPPADYKPPVVKVSDKVMIPQEEHPDINFVGLLIGPRGNTLKSMEKDTGAKIIIRGKGSVKEGKVGRKDGGPMPGEDEPLHAYVTASNPEAVKKAVDRIKEIIRQGVEVPEGQNDLRRMQLRELALLNGTLRENDGPRCSNCGSTSHKQWQCPDKPNITNSVICSGCGGVGHIAKDCRQRKQGGQQGNQMVDRQKIDEEYMSLMAELGEGPPPPHNKNENRGGNNSPQIRSLFDTPVGPPRAIMAPPPPANNGPQTNQMGSNSSNSTSSTMRNNQGSNDSNWSGPSNGNQQQFNRQTNRLVLGHSGNNQQQQSFNRPPPMNNWQGGNQNQNNSFNNQNQGPPPNILAQPPPPPPPTPYQQQQPQNSQQQSQWMNQGQSGPPGMNWQSGGPPQSMGCPPPGPVPAPRPVGPPPQGFGWNGNQMGPPGTNMGPGGPPTGKQMDLGAFLWNSAPPPPPPPPSNSS